MKRRYTSPINYKGYIIEETDCTTTVIRECCGHRYESIESLYEIRKDSEAAKPYGRRPFITSVSQAKAWINDSRIHLDAEEFEGLCRH